MADRKQEFQQKLNALLREYDDVLSDTEKQRLRMQEASAEKIHILWLDDERNPFNKIWTDWLHEYLILDWAHAEITWVKRYYQFVNHLEECGVPDVICFDHDLGEEKTGYDCVKYLCDYCIENEEELPMVVYQTNNPVGKENMRKYIENYMKHKQVSKFFNKK